MKKNKNKDKKLTIKQKRFAEEYIIDLNGKQAAIRAGYSPKTAIVQGSRLLTYANVYEYKEKLLRERAEANKITQEFVLENLRKVVVVATQQRPSGFVDEENKIINTLIDVSGTNKALELLGRHLGMFTDKVETSGASVVEVIVVDKSLVEKDAADNDENTE